MRGCDHFEGLISPFLGFIGLGFARRFDEPFGLFGVVGLGGLFFRHAPQCSVVKRQFKLRWIERLPCVP
jgi:hypothetical protein